MNGQPKGHTLFVYTSCTGDIKHHLRDTQRNGGDPMKGIHNNRKICNEEMNPGLGVNV